MLDNSWVENELAIANFSDERLKKRCMKILTDLSEQCQKSIPVACKGWAETKASYRFFDNDNVTDKKVLTPHQEATLNRISRENVVVIPQDTTELDFTGTRVASHLGPLNYAERVGWFLHLSAAFTLDRVCLGVIAAKVWTRDPDDPQKSKRRKTTSFADKESARWVNGYKQACQIAAKTTSTKIISVADRESDIYELYMEAKNGEADWVVRANQNRSLPDKLPGTKATYDKLWNRASKAQIIGELSVNLPAKGGRPARSADMTARALVLELRPPYRSDMKLEALTIHAVLLKEETPTDGVEPLEWLLLTSLPIETWSDVQLVIECYLCRWQIECFFKVLKSGCQVEKLQLEKPERLLPCLAIYMIVAWRILYITMLGRSCPDLPCTVVFGDAEWKAVTVIETGAPPPITPPSLGEMLKRVARQGSYIGRNGDGHPGIVSIWVGLQRVMDYARAWEAFGPESKTYG